MSATPFDRVLSYKAVTVKYFILLLVILSVSACSTLQQKIAAGDENAISLAIESGVDLNKQDSVGNTALMMAAKYQPDSVADLLGAGADINIVSTGGWTALLRAARYQPDAVADLLSAGADTTLKTDDGWTALLLAARYQPDAVADLLRAGADINLQMDDGWTALLLAVQYQPDAVADLLSAGANTAFKTDDGWTALLLAARDQPDAVADLLSAGADTNLQMDAGWTALMLAVRYQPDAVAVLLSAGADTNLKKDGGWTALMLAAKYQPNAILSILNAGADIQYHDENGDDVYDLAKLDVTGKSTEILEIYRVTYQREVLAELKINQACQLIQKDWVYLSKECSGEYAHGYGEAKNIDGLTFVGRFKNGYRIEGEIFANDSLMYEGTFQDDKPHGSGVCIHKGEPEECKFYKGKRIDTLFKQRIEFSKQNALLAEQQLKIDEKLDNLAKTRSVGNQTMSSGITDALQKKATEKATDYLFDQLF